jgi:hypothetical protein
MAARKVTDSQAAVERRETVPDEGLLAWPGTLVRMRLDWSESAVSDLKTISEYIEQDRDMGTANRVTPDGLRIDPELATLSYLVVTGAPTALANC